MRTLLIYLAVLVTLTGAVTLGELDEILKARHPPGAASYGMADLSGSLFSPDLNQLDEVVNGSWQLGVSEKFTDPANVARAHVVVDWGFAVAYATLLMLLAAGLRRRFEAASDPPELKEIAERRLATRRIEVNDHSVLEELADLRPRIATYRRLARVAFGAAALALVFDIVEGVLQLLALDDQSRLLAGALYGVTVAKWVLLAVVLVGLLLGALGLDIIHPRWRRGLVATLVVSRAPLLFAVLLPVAFLTDATPFGEQASDVLLGWKENPLDAFVAVVLFAWLSVLVFVLSRRLLEPLPDTRRAAAMSAQGESLYGRPMPIDLRKRLPLWFLFLVGLWLACVGLLLHYHEAGGAGIFVAAGILVAVPVASRLIRRAESAPLPALGAGTRTVPALAAATPLLVLGLALVQATVVEIAWAQRFVFLVFTVGGLLLVVVGLAAFVVARSDRAQWLVDHAWFVIGPTLGLLAYVVLRIWLHPWRTADALGAFGVFAAAAGAALLAAYLLMGLEERRRPPSVFAVFRLRRIPVFALVLLWSLIAALLDKGGFHDVRQLDGAAARQPAGREQGLSVDEAFKRWLRQNPRPEPQPGADPAEGPRRARPLVLVAAAGGGVRAAYWTGLVVDCIFHGNEEPACETPSAERPPEASVFAAASASGGSVGLANWVARLRTGDETWLNHLGDDSLSPTLAWALFVDLPNAFVKLNGFGDRAEVLERTWEQQWEGREGGFAELVHPFRKGPPSGGPLAEGLFAASSDDSTPLLLLSSTSVEDGCRFAVSVLDANVGRQRPGTLIEDCLGVRAFEEKPAQDRLGWAFAATKDLDDYLCEERDLRLSTAALLSARFPYVSPSGRLVRCGDTTGNSTTYLVDGGYYDNTGASPLIELWAALEPVATRHNEDENDCVAPFVLEIDNHYGDEPGPEPDPRPKESQVPLQTLFGTRGAHEASARQSLALGASIPFGNGQVVVDESGEIVDRYASIFPRAHPGTRAPLGWTLSEASQGDLERELNSDPNLREIAKVRSWLEGDLWCNAAPREQPEPGEGGTG